MCLIKSEVTCEGHGFAVHDLAEDHGSWSLQFESYTIELIFQDLYDGLKLTF